MVNIGSKKIGAFLGLFIGIMIVIIINQISTKYFFRTDLTEEKRFTISNSTIQILENLQDAVYIDVYLDGDLPAPFKRLQKAIKETLEEFKVYTGDNLQFNFINPSTAATEKARNGFYQNLARKGIQPTNLYDSKDGKKTQNLIFPGAIVSYGLKETAVMLLGGNKTASPQEQLNQSIENIEYILSNAIQKLSQPIFKKIAILQGHGELDTLQSAGLYTVVSEQYKVRYVNLSWLTELSGYDAMIMAKPTKPFNSLDKFKIDQFIMRGGKAFFLIDMLTVNMDSAGGTGTYAFPETLNLDDLLFKYGFRLNQDFVIDLMAGKYPVVVGNMGQNPQVKLMTWPFYPLINNFSNHPIVKNMDAISTRFVGTIDTVKAQGIKRTPLMTTSKYSRILSSPVHVGVNDLKNELKPESFNAGPQHISWLAEGRFTSLYKNHFLPSSMDTSQFIAEGRESAIVVVSDGDLARNDFNPKTKAPLELGLDPFTKTKFANADFVLNTLAYMVEDDGLINTRSKEVTIRPLDEIKIKENKLFIQLINVIAPVILIIVFGLIKNILRRNKYARFKDDTGE